VIDFLTDDFQKLAPKEKFATDRTEALEINFLGGRVEGAAADGSVRDSICPKGANDECTNIERRKHGKQSDGGSSFHP
jgi:hypothetical protein